jgi:Secretion system C-terminal sorting domain
MKKIYTIIFLVLLSSNLFAQCTTNYLINPSFETPVQPGLGNNFPPPYNVFGGWSIPTATAGTAIGGFNVIKVDGTGYSGGPNTGHNGDQYVDVNGAAGIVEQSFTTTCPSSDIEFSGWYSRREPGGVDFTNNIEIINASNLVVATSNNVSFTSSESEEVWKQASGTATGLPAGTYRFRFIMDNYANVDDAFLCVTTGCILATKLSTFTATASKCAAKLSWAATTEGDLKNYEIQSSEDGNIFKTINTVAPKTAESINNYSFSAAANSGKLFYRLKMINVDGKYTYSDIVPLTVNCEEGTVKIYPNPTSDFLQVNINKNKTSTVVVLNTAGKTVLSATLQADYNNINLKAMPAGLYVVKVVNELGVQNFKITKL